MTAHRPNPPQHIRPCVGAVVLNTEHQVLAIQRLDNGLWALPTGHIEPGETVSQALVREVAEETGLTVRIERLVGLYSDPATQVLTVANGRREHFVTACLLCAATGGRLKLQPEEVVDAGFFSPNDVPSPRVESHMAWIKAAVSSSAPIID